MTDREARQARAARLRRVHAERFGPGPLRFARAPGRVNLIGEHTDYQLGYVLPIALDRDIWIAFRASESALARAVSLDLGEEVALDLKVGPAGPPGHWSRYLHGLAAVLRGVGHELRGIDAVVQGEVPTGAGLSSSAALLVAWGLALADAGGLALEPAELAHAARLAEHRYAGVRSGPMDFVVALHGRPEGPILIDCADGSFRPVPGPPVGAVLLLTWSGVKHELAATAYNERVAQCEAALRALGALELPGLRALRSVDEGLLEGVRSELEPVLYRRARHVVRENVRVLAAVSALEAGDAAWLGRLLRESHESLRDDYEVSCAEIDTLVELACGVDGVFGSRITGGGFGGATVTLLERDAVERFREQVAAGYRAARGREATFLEVVAGAGASVGELTGSARWC
ncbi:MAG: galactokinase [Planctomycetes bacterium]|nr:galactokinase [Planctomycetota bacterium]